MGSSRLPGKVLADVGGVPALTRLLRRLRACPGIDDVILATSVSPADDALEEWAASEEVRVHRGSEDDVLDRVVAAHREAQTDVIVEVTGDCTLLDPEVIELGLQTYFANECDVLTNTRLPSYPLGADVQVFRFEDLERVAATITDSAVREHVSLYFYENPDKYRVLHLLAPESWRAPHLRLMLDYPEDLAFIREVYSRLEPTYGDSFGISRILALLREEPQLQEINSRMRSKPVR